MEYSREMIEYASRFIGQPYQWGKQGPIFWDCSGFILEVLKAFGRVDDKVDMTAKDLFRYLLNNNWKVGLQAGSILFFGGRESQFEKISHVGIAYNRSLFIGANSGNSTTKTLDKAIEQNAFIKLRPIRKDLIVSLFHPDDKIFEYKTANLSICA
jgi:cell wall-associated NlpC family hydrolase